MALKLESPKVELAVLRAMTGRAKDIAGFLVGSTDETFFASPETKEVFNHIREAAASTGEVPTFRMIVDDPELSREARQFFRNSERLIETKVGAVKAVELLNKYRQTRGIYELSIQIARRMENSKQDLGATLDYLSSAVASIRSSKNIVNAFLHLGQSNNAMAMIKDMIYGESNEIVIPTGLKPFDAQSGGLTRGSFVSIGASSGGGKSLVSNWMAMHQAWLGYRVIYIPLEMTKQEMLARQMAAVSLIDNTRVLHKKLTASEKTRVEQTYVKWLRMVKKRGGRLTLFKPEMGLDMEDTLNAANTLDADVLYVDSMNLLNGANDEDGWRKLSEMGRLAKINADQMHRVNVGVVQVSEDLKVRYSKAITEHSNNSFVWSTKKEEREKPIGTITVEQPKARASASFPFRLGIEWANMRVVNAAAPDTKDKPTKPTKSSLTDL